MDKVCHMLADVHRRRVLIHLEESEQTPAVVQVPEDIVDEPSDLERLHVKLQHAHLPKLEQHGYIQWEQETHTVRRGPKFDAIQPLLRLLQAHEEDLPGQLI